MNTESKATRIDRLELQNFRAFGELVIEFDPRLTVLVAENGGGKTTVLDALAISLHSWVHPLIGGDKIELSASNVRRAVGHLNGMQTVFPCCILAWGEMHGVKGQWNQLRENASGSVDTLTHTLELAWRGMRSHLQDYSLKKRMDSPILPLIAYYGAGRLWDGVRARRGSRNRTPPDTNRLNGYLECLTASSHYRFFADWFERYSREATLEELSGNPSPHQPAKRLLAVRQATDGVLAPTGWRNIEWDFSMETLVANHSSLGRLAVDALSDGIRNGIGLVADLAYRAAHLNPQLGERSALETPGIVLIDEVDLHLHPRWQQRILPTLLNAFPKVQFIVTTHSPQVLSTALASSIRVLKIQDGVGIAETPRFQTKGVESNDILAVIMGIDPIPEVEEATWVSRYRALIEDGNNGSEEGQQLRSRLLNHFGASHPILLDCDRLIRWRAFKMHKTSEREGTTGEKT